MKILQLPEKFIYLKHFLIIELNLFGTPDQLRFVNLLISKWLWLFSL